MILYAESSAILAWLLGENGSADSRDALAGAELIFTSDLTLIECDRVIIRATTLGLLTEAVAADRRATLRQLAEHWIVFHVDEEIVERARHPFPKEPIRSLDAIHLATAIAARAAVPGVALLSLDERIRSAARESGFITLPGADIQDATASLPQR